MKILKRFLMVAALGGVAAMCGCRTPMKDYETSLISGDYVRAAEIADNETSNDSKDELMWRLMSGGALRLAGMNDAAIARFDRAEDVMIDNDGTSVFAKGATGTWAMMTNDKAFPYEGGGQDRIFTCLYKAIDFAASGNSDAARTELNRAAQHQENWLHERRKDIAAANERLEKDSAAYQREKQSQNPGAHQDADTGKVVDGAFADAAFSSQIKDQCGFDTATSGVLDNLQPVDWMNPYVSHVTGVFRWLNGDTAREHLKDAATCRKDNPVAVRDFAECEQGGKPKDQVWVWIEDGLGPRREEWRLDLPLVLLPYVGRFVMYAGMALPYLEYRAAAGDGWQVQSAHGNSAASELVDMDAKMKLEYDVYFRGALAREITRTVVKVGTQVALGVVAENVSDSNTYWALKGSQIAAAAWAASTTGADTRSWTTLPKKVYAARIPRPSDGVVAISNSSGIVTEVTVPAGNSMVFVSKPSSMAKASVKVVTYP